MPPLPGQRRRHILDAVQAHGVVRVSDLSSDLGVAAETIRRDLKQLDDDGRLIRTHGGALLPTALSVGERVDAAGGAGPAPEPVSTHQSFQARRRLAAPEKETIAAAAAAHVRANMTIALDGSTTACALADRLPDVTLTVITNSLVITNLLAARAGGDGALPGLRVICTGGTLNPRLQSFDGVLADAALERLGIDVAFFSCRGIDPARGLSDPTDAAARFKRRLVELSRQSVVLADHSKFGAQGAVLFAAPDDVDVLITDTPPQPEAADAFRRAGVAVEVAASDMAGSHT